MANASAIWQHAAHTTYQLSSPRRERYNTSKYPHLITYNPPVFAGADATLSRWRDVKLQEPINLPSLWSSSHASRRSASRLARWTCPSRCRFLARLPSARHALLWTRVIDLLPWCSPSFPKQNASTAATNAWWSNGSTEHEWMNEWNERMNEWMNENLYIAHTKLPHKTLRVHSARYTHQRKLSRAKNYQRTFVPIKYKQPLPTYPIRNV